MNQLPDAVTLAHLVTSVTETMCGITFAPADQRAPLPQCWRMVLLPITGKRDLEVAIFSDKASCEAIGSALLSLAKDELDTTMIEDSLRELLNIAAGQIKQAVAPDHVLGLPRVIMETELDDRHIQARDQGVLLRTNGPVHLFIWITEGATRH